MIDIHTHILPGIDDGTTTDDEALEFARVAAGDGTRTIVATPHCKEGYFFNDRAIVLDRVAALRKLLVGAGVEIELLPGGEVHVCADLVERVRDGRAPTLADNGKTLLLELSLAQHHVGLEELVFQLKLAGLVVVFAHPERIRYFQDDGSRYEEMIRLGAYGQITTGSILGTFGETAREFSEELLRKGLVHVLATDGHNLRGRHPRMSEARAACAAMVGEAYASAMTLDAPRALLAGNEPELPECDVPRARSRGSFLSRWFRRG